MTRTHNVFCIDTYIVRLFDERRWIGRRTTNIWHFSEYQMRNRLYLSPPPRNIVSFDIFSSYLAFFPLKVWPKVCNHFPDYTRIKMCNLIMRWGRSSTERSLTRLHSFVREFQGRQLSYHLAPITNSLNDSLSNLTHFLLEVQHFWSFSTQ